MAYKPLAFDVALYAVSVAALRAIMEAPTTTLPLGSVTVPFNWAFSIPWANARWATQERTAKASRTHTTVEKRFISAS